MAKKMTVKAMYHDVAIQLAIFGLVHEGNGADAIADIDQEQQQQQRHENEPQPQAGRKEDDGGGKRHQLVGAGLDENDRADWLRPATPARAAARARAVQTVTDRGKSPAVAAYVIDTLNHATVRNASA